MTKEQFIEHLCNYFNINKNFSKNLVEAGCRNISDVYKYLDIIPNLGGYFGAYQINECHKERKRCFEYKIA